MPDEIGDDMSKKCDGDGCEKCAKKGADIESLKKKIRKVQELYTALCVRFEELQANYDNLAKAST